jgi:hypothetical protein
MDRRRALTVITAVLPAAATWPATAQVPAPQPATRPTMGTASSPLPPIPRLSISPAVAARVGQQVWQNESGRSIDGLTTWNDGEDFPSLGIGHCIWFKAGGHPIFEESFPRLMMYMRERGVRLPAWLDRPQIPPCPSPSRSEFYRRFREPQLTELRRLLADTIPLQTQFLLARAEAAAPKMLATLATEGDKRHLLIQLNRVVRSSPDLYPLIDYVNFKGEGISEKETRFDPVTRRNEGWGLKHLLLEMKGDAEGAPALAEFSRASKYVLDRRIRNHPPSQRWREGWHKRCNTYARPLA